jgi:hypothetical protein
MLLSYPKTARAPKKTTGGFIRSMPERLDEIITALLNRLNPTRRPCQFIVQSGAPLRIIRLHDFRPFLTVNTDCARKKTARSYYAPSDTLRINGGDCRRELRLIIEGTDQKFCVVGRETHRRVKSFQTTFLTRRES